MNFYFCILFFSQSFVCVCVRLAHLDIRERLHTILCRLNCLRSTGEGTLYCRSMSSLPLGRMLTRSLMTVDKPISCAVAFSFILGILAECLPSRSPRPAQCL